MPRVSLQEIQPPPTTLPPWGKLLWYLAKTLAQGAAYAAYDYAKEIQATPSSETDPPTSTWRKFSVKVENNLSTQTADDQIVNFEIAKYTNGNLDSDWIDDDYNAVWASLSVIVSGLMTRAPAYLTATSVRAYIRGYNPYTEEKTFMDSGPPGLITTNEPQMCSSVTEETPVRKHWGRFYTPTTGGNYIQANGRYDTAFVDGLAQLVHDNYEFLYSIGYPPVVPTVSTGASKADPDGKPLRSLQTVTGIRVDDIPDVIRRRRYRTAAYRKVLPVPTELELEASA